MLVRSPVALNGRMVRMAGGDRGVFQTVATMRAMTNEAKKHPAIRATAMNLLQYAGERNQYAEISAIFDFVRDDVRYTRDVVGVETLTDPARTLQLMAGDCDDQSMLLAALLESVGYPTRFVVAAYRNPRVFEHVFVQTCMRGGLGGVVWLSLDPTEPGAVGYAPPGSRRIWIEKRGA